MARKKAARWHAGNKAWTSAAGDPGENGRPKPVYFREIPYGPPGSPNWRKAQAALEEHLKAREAREARNASGADLSLRRIGEAYLRWLTKRVEAEKAKPLTLKGHLQAIKRFNNVPSPAGGFMGNRPAIELTASEMSRAVDHLAGEGYAPNYIGRIVGSVQAALNWATDPLPGREPEKILATNPIAKFSHEATKAPQSPDRYAEEAEIRAFLDWGYKRARDYRRAASPKRPAFRGECEVERRFERLTIDLILVAWLSGARPGELRVAEWADFDPKVGRDEAGEWWGRILLDPKRWKSGSKTKRAREVLLPPEAVAVIEAIRALPDHHPRFIWTHRIGSRAKAGAGATTSSPWHGVPWSASSLPTKVATLRKLAIAAGVPIKGVGHDRFVMYRLRHTRAAKLLMADGNVATVAKLLGTSIQMIETVYASYTTKHLVDAASRAIGPSPPGPPATGEGKDEA